MKKTLSCLANPALLIAVILSLPGAFNSTYAATPYTQAEACLDSPAIAAGSGFSTCKKPGCGPQYNTDLIRVQDPTKGGAQNWQPWATVAASTQVVGCTNGAITSVWTPKSTITANPPAPPSTTPPPVPKVGTFTLTWQPPTLNTDNSVIAASSLTYSIQHGSSLTGPWDIAVVANQATYAYKGLPITIRQCFQVAAVSTVDGVATIGGYAPICAAANSIPVAPSVPGGVQSLKMTIDATTP